LQRKGGAESAEEEREQFSPGFRARDESEGRSFVAVGSGASEGTTSGFAKSSEMRTTIGRRAGLSSGDFVAEREAKLGGNTLISSISEESASSSEGILAEITGITTRFMTSEDNCFSRCSNGRSNDLSGGRHSWS